MVAVPVLVGQDENKNVVAQMVFGILKLWFETKVVLMEDRYKLMNILYPKDDLVSLQYMVIHDFHLPYCPVSLVPKRIKQQVNEYTTRTTLGSMFYDGNTGRPVKIELYEGGNNPYTLTHELAHLKHNNHGWRFYKFHLKLLKWYVERKRT